MCVCVCVCVVCVCVCWEELGYDPEICDSQLLLFHSDAMKTWPAMQKWTNEFLEKQFGKNDVRVAFAPNGDYEGCDKASRFEGYKQFNFPEVVKSQLLFPDLVVVRPAFLNINFSSFMDLVRRPSPNVSAYLEYSSIPSLLPELRRDIKEMPFVSGILKKKHLNIWLSDGKTLGKLHFDPFDNFLCQVSNDCRFYTIFRTYKKSWLTTSP